jgi:hypothetical protein
MKFSATSVTCSPLEAANRLSTSGEDGTGKVQRAEESGRKITKCISLCILSGLCVSVVNVFVGKSITETRSAPSSHRELEIIPTDCAGWVGSNRDRDSLH